MYRTTLLLLAMSIFLLSMTPIVCAQAPEWVQRELEALRVEPISAKDTGTPLVSHPVAGSSVRIPIVVKPEVIQPHVPERPASATPLGLAFRQQPPAGYSNVNQPSQRAHAAYPGNGPLVPYAQVTGHVLLPAHPSAVVDAADCAGRPGTPVYWAPAHSASHHPASQISKRAYRYGDFGATTYRQFHQQTGNTTFSTTWSW